MNPDPLTLRELAWMAEGVQRVQWAQTSAVLAMLANAHRDPKRKPTPFKPDDFNPWAERRGPTTAMKVNIDALKVFLRDMGGEEQKK